MKTLLYKFVIAVVFITCNPFNILPAQDWSKLEAKTVAMLVDTSLLRAMEVTIMPGEKGEVHTHPAYLFYALTDGKLMVHYTDGKNEQFDMKMGDCGYADPEKPHWTENVSDKPVKFLLVELKEHPFKARKKQ